MNKLYKGLFIIAPIFILCACTGNGAGTSKDEDSLSSSSSQTLEEELSNYSILTGDRLVSERPMVKWEGRYEYKIGDSDIPNSVYLYNTATGFTIDFYGTSLKVGFYHSSTNIYYDYKIDDERLPNVNNRRFYLPNTQTMSVITLANDLPLGRHSITCLKMDEGADAFTSVYSFETDGKFYFRDVNKDNERLKFMFVCASYGSGYGSLAYSETSKTEFSRKRNNSSSLHAFTYLTARRFDADVQYMAQAGWGIRYPEHKAMSKVIDQTGITPSNDVTGSLTTREWDHTKYVPDIILFHLGGNDMDDDKFNVSEYQIAVVGMVNKLHGYYPKAKMIWAHTESTAAGYALEALDKYGNIEDGYIKPCVFPKIGQGETGTGTYGASSHPSLKTQIDASNVITDFIKTNYGLQPSVEQISFNDFEFLLERNN